MNKEEREKYISVKLYKYLCDKVGTEKVVRYQRLYFKVLDDSFTAKTCFGIPHENISSGSRAEGLSLPGSDFDIMVCDKRFPVVESHGSNANMLFNYRNINTLIMMDDNSMPGYVNLLVHPFNTFLLHISTKTEYGFMLSSSQLKVWYGNHLVSSTFYNPRYSGEHIHGPCVSDATESRDVAYCVHLNTWPHISKHWLLRNRPYKWPTEWLVYQIASQGVHFVPIGSKDQELSYEWRISFSVPEKLLIHSFNHTQLLCYAVLKIILKQLINQEKDLNNILCSYFMKTVVFWVSEETDSNYWKPENLLGCISLCTNRLQIWTENEYIPNYFIPQQNMIDGKLNARQKQLLLQTLKWINSNQLKSFSLCKFFNRFNADGINISRTHIKENSNFQKAIIPFVSYTPVTFRYLSLLLDFIMVSRKCLTRINTVESTQVKLLYAYCFAWLHQSIALSWTSIPNPINLFRKSFNRGTYEKYKSCLSFVLISANTDPLAGWFFLATFFYAGKQYKKVLRLLHLMMTGNIFPGEFKRHGCSCIESKYGIQVKSSFFKKLRTTLISDITILFYFHKNPLCHSKDLTCGENSVIFPPMVYFHFLRFWCYHLQNEQLRKESLRDLIETTYTYQECRCGVTDSYILSYAYLVRVFMVTMDKGRAMRAYIDFIHGMRSHKLYELFHSLGITPLWEQKIPNVIAKLSEPSN